nr:hypothetical protein CFP56_69431 [Quercus suber]
MRMDLEELRPQQILPSFVPLSSLLALVMDPLECTILQSTTMKGNELDKSNQPPHLAIWKPPPWPILKVNFDDANFQEKNYVVFLAETRVDDARLKEVMRKFQCESVFVYLVTFRGGGSLFFWGFTIDVTVEVSGTNYTDALFQGDYRAGIGLIIRDCQVSC